MFKFVSQFNHFLMVGRFHHQIIHFRLHLLRSQIIHRPLHQILILPIHHFLHFHFPNQNLLLTNHFPLIYRFCFILNQLGFIMFLFYFLLAFHSRWLLPLLVELLTEIWRLSFYQQVQAHHRHLTHSISFASSPASLFSPMLYPYHLLFSSQVRLFSCHFQFLIM